MKKIFAILLFAIAVIPASMQAQTKQYYNVGWDVGMPMGDFSDFISKTSLRGGSFSGNIFLTEAFSVGFKFGYNSYHEDHPRQITQLAPGQFVTAETYNSMMNAPILVGPYYHFNLGTVEPYIGLGLGVNYITEEIIVQDYDFVNDQWAFLMNPEIGIRVPFGKDIPLALTVKAGYNFNFNTYQPFQEEYKNLQTLNLGVALSWTVK